MRKLFWIKFLLTHLNNKKGFLKRGIHIDIIPTTRCQYSCSYCPMFLDGPVKRYEECTIDEWITFFERQQHLVSTYYISGGEPGLYKDIVPMANYLLSKGHQVIIMTNLSYPEKFAGIKNSWRLMFMPTFHPEFAKMDKFKAGLKWLKDNGYNYTSQQILQNDGNFNRIKEFFSVDWFKNGDTNLQFAPDSPKTLQIYVGCVNVFKADK